MGRPKAEIKDITPLHPMVMSEPNSGCWLWVAALDGGGYGQAWDGSKQRRAHRLSWEQHKGEIPEGLHVLHKCDVRCCVNSDHLFLGTHDDNMADMRAKKRRNGERASWPKLTEAQVIEIFNSPEPCPVIAARYGVSRSTPLFIKQGRSWKHLNLRTGDENHD